MAAVSLDKQTRLAIEQTVFRAVQEAMETTAEVWLTPEQLIEQVGFFSPEWIKRNGKMLPRETYRWRDENGVLHEGRYTYPKHKIQRMISEGAFREMSLKPTIKN